MHNRMGHRFQRRIDVPNWLEPKTQEEVAYSDKVLALGPIRYWPLWDLAGVNAEELVVGDTGTYVNAPVLGQAGIGDGRTSVLFDGVNQYCDIFSAAFAAAFNDAEGTMVGWFRVSAAGVWNDGVFRVAMQCAVNGTNQVQLNKSSGVPAVLVGEYVAGGVTETRAFLVSPTIFFNLGITWSVAADEVRVFYNGIQQGATMTVLGAWVGAIVAVRTNIATRFAPLTNNWDGFAAHCLVFDAPQTPATMLEIATV